MAAEAFDFNNHAYRRFVETIKVSQEIFNTCRGGARQVKL